MFLVLQTVPPTPHSSMSTTVFDHYAQHLAPIYSWMVGDFEAACSQVDSFYTEVGLPAGEGRLAVDLGCGHGVHTIPLARRGYQVISLDTSTHLLGELKTAAGNLPIHPIAADLTEFAAHLPSRNASLIACMGDTLTHLPTVDAVDSLIREAAQHLSPDGVLTLSFRDYATHELTSAQRFIPVRSDSHRIHTCFLEYREDTVLVHDIIHSRSGDSWNIAVSAYPKLRVHPDHVIAAAESCGMSITRRSITRGMLYFAFKPSTAVKAG